MRRLQFTGAFGLALLLALHGCTMQSASFRSDWDEGIERPWVGADYWSNPLQDWRVREGRLENFGPGGDRNVFLLTREIDAGEGTLDMSVRLGRIDDDETPLEEGWAGFRVGIRGSFDDYRDSAVRGVGLNCGMASDGRLFIGAPSESSPVASNAFQEEVRLSLAAAPSEEGYALTLRAETADGEHTVSEQVEANWLPGGLALVSSSGPIPDSPPAEQQVRETGWSLKPGTRRGGTMRLWFRDWQVSGSKVSAHPERALGPIMFAMHTLSKGVLKLNAMIAPIGTGPRTATLEIEDDGWKEVARAQLDPEARTATFRVADWDDTNDTPYRVVYDGDTWEGIVRKDPADKGEIVVAAFTGNNDLGFPHADIVRNSALYL